MEIRRVLCLAEHTSFHKPTSWDFHTRYALQRGGGEIVVPAGTWLVELDPVETWPDQKTDYLYRTPSGEIIALESPLPTDRYSEVIDPQVVTALNAFRTLGAILEEDFGMTLYRTCRELAPFTLIQCPLCSGRSFTTLDLASAWCDRCNAAFQVRSTAGDPGFVVDVTWKNYNPLAARFVLPRTDKLLSTLVLKDSGDPRDMSRDQCSNECRAGPILLTDGSTGLRPGLHRCQIGTLYDWRCIYGRIPTPEDLREETNWEIDGQGWPAAASSRVLPLTRSERRALELATNVLQKELPSASREIQEILNVRSQSPVVFEAVLPDVQNLQREERYILHHWLAISPDTIYGGYETALPVWYVVTPVVEARYLAGWKVVRKDICPRCGGVVSPQDVAASEKGRNRWDIPHGYCRETWEKTGWRCPERRPPDAGGGTVENQVLPMEAVDDPENS